MSRNELRPVREDRRITMLNEGLSKLYEDYFKEDSVEDFDDAYVKIGDIFAEEYGAADDVGVEYNDLGAECSYDELINGGMHYSTEYAEAPQYVEHAWTVDEWTYYCSDWYEILVEYLDDKREEEWKELTPAELVAAFKSGDFYEYLVEYCRELAIMDAVDNAEEPAWDY